MNLFVDRMPSPIGTLLLVWQGNGLRALDFGDNKERFERILRIGYAGASLEPEPAPAAIRDPIEAYFQGDVTAIDGVTVEANGTPF